MKNEYTIYSIEECKYCEMAKAIFDSMRIPYHLVKIADDEKSDFLDRIGMTGDDRKFPRVFKDGVLFGGADSVKEAMILGKL